MKVMLPVIDKENEIVAEGFRNARFLCIYDSDSKSLDWMNAKSLFEIEGDFNNEIRSMGIRNVICGNMQPITLRIFARSKIEVFKAKGNNVSKNLFLFRNNQLNLFTTQEAREMQACKSSCSSCNSTSCN